MLDPVACLIKTSRDLSHQIKCPGSPQPANPAWPGPRLALPPPGGPPHTCASHSSLWNTSDSFLAPSRLCTCCSLGLQCASSGLQFLGLCPHPQPHQSCSVSHPDWLPRFCLLRLANVPYLAMSGLSGGRWALPLQHVGSTVRALYLRHVGSLAVGCGPQFPDQGVNPRPLHY